MSGLAQLPVFCLLVMATLAVALPVREGRRRNALNGALHELRRPLQAIALRGGGDGAVELAAAALDRLDREINGGGRRQAARRAVALEPIVGAAVRRWRDRAELAGRELSMRWRCERVSVEAEPETLGQALDNLIVNAIEHGRGAVVVEVSGSEAGVTVSVRDGERLEGSLGVSGPPLARARRRGHGLAAVRREALRLGGGFELRRAREGAEAVLRLEPGTE